MISGEKSIEEPQRAKGGKERNPSDYRKVVLMCAWGNPYFQSYINLFY
jgi:hypothetical protein